MDLLIGIFDPAQTRSTKPNDPTMSLRYWNTAAERERAFKLILFKM
jgi:hypothetical protein